MSDEQNPDSGSSSHTSFQSGLRPHPAEKGWVAVHWDRVRRYFLAGMLVLLPAAFALFVIWQVMEVADSLFGWLVDQFFIAVLNPEDPDRFKDTIGNRTYLRAVKNVVSFVFALFFIIAVGWLSTFLLVRRAITFGERLVDRLPFVKFLYNTPKEVLSTFTSSKLTSFKRVVLLEYPRRGIWALGFATGELRQSPNDRHLISVFVPTTPNPTSGFLLLVPAEDVLDTNIPVEDGARLIISGGILSPERIYSQRFAGMDVTPRMPPLGPLVPDPNLDDLPPPNSTPPEETPHGRT